jgi:hypothetical protein
MDNQPVIESLCQLLGKRDIPGTPEQLERLSIRLQELAELNGAEWVAGNRERLLKQWSAAIGRKT